MRRPAMVAGLGRLAPLLPLAALGLSLGGFSALTAAVKWRHPGGPDLPGGLGLALLLSLLALLVSVAAVRLRPTVLTILAVVAPLLIALACLVRLVGQLSAPR